MNWTVFFFELGYFLNIIGIAILISNIIKKNQVEGISFYSQLLFAISTFSKIFFFWFTLLRDYVMCWIELVISVLLTVWLLHLLIKHRKNSFMKEKNHFDWRLLVIVSFILAVISNYEKEEAFEISQLMIRFSIIVEAFGLLPQIHFMKDQKYVPQFFGYYLTTISISRLARIGFWVFQLMYNYTGSTYYTLIIADSCYLVLTADIVYNFFKHRDSNLIPYF